MFMYDDEFKHMAKYMDIYELLLSNGPKHQDEIKRALIEAGMPETSARRNAADFWFSDSDLIWSDDKERKYLNHEQACYFIYELAEALKVVIYGEALMKDIEDKYKDKIRDLNVRIKELSVENSTNLNHCNKHYEDLMEAQRTIAELRHDLENAKNAKDALSDELANARTDMIALTASPWSMFKGFVKALWKKSNKQGKERKIDG